MAKFQTDTPHKLEFFKNEFMPHIEALKTFAFHLTYNEADADDLIQETYMKAFKFMDKYEKGTNAKAWLFKILKNAYINEYRKKVKSPQKVDVDDVGLVKTTENQNERLKADLRDDIYTNELGDEVTKALDKLPEDFRTVILLCDIEGFSYEEMSKIIDIPVGTIRSRLFRARNALKELLKPYAEKMGYEDFRGRRRSRNEEE
ncbi:MAG TPA: RNA polymerase subunit sigma [Saprospirales bacterium]|nr:RNA polymerase subunit sigma [Saprospirales bacterium]HAY70605.1 RNA polymerase subunit sigma [Saprospirales bacterium]HRQ28424.1 sigma-70 family RNA polymerase sigma factor [Saprospiraceae bacterium]